jgi:DUF2075 family protein
MATSVFGVQALEPFEEVSSVLTFLGFDYDHGGFALGAV